MTKQPITKEAAVAALTAAAITERNPQTGRAGRTTVHCTTRYGGDRWDLDTAVEFVGVADEVAWETESLGHDLVVVCDGRVYRFAARRPIAATHHRDDEETQ